MRRIAVDTHLLASDSPTLRGKEYRYLVRVLRLREGEELLLFDGRGRFARARITRIDNEAGEAQLAKVHEGVEADRRPIDLRLNISLLKGERMDLVIQKSSELGVSSIRPILTTHCVAQLGERRNSKFKRWRKIMQEACRQSEQLYLPELLEPLSLGELIEGDSRDGRTGLVALERSAASSELLGALEVMDLRNPLSLLVGPEGGFSAAEISLLVGSGIRAVNLGPSVLRAETAAIAGVAIVCAKSWQLG